MVTVFIPKESDGEQRVAATPETVDKLSKTGVSVHVEAGAGATAFIPDAAYAKSGARSGGAIDKADVVFKVRELSHREADKLKSGSIVVASFVPQQDTDLIDTCCERKVTLFSLNLVPRISRAQKMDVLSSQANIAGYKAVLLAATALPKYFPLLMTAAGTVKPAKVIVMGVGVAGLQAIATAKRLGAQVWATDIRIATREQVLSLGAKFIDVEGMEDMEDAGGYAKEVTPEFLAKQRATVAEHLTEADVVITTAQVPGRKAPILISNDELARMKPGAVIVDLAAEQGGNCESTKAGESVVKGGVTIIGPRNLPGTVATHASELYARNVLAFAQSFITKEGTINLNWEDEVLAKSVVTHDGEVIHEQTAEAMGRKPGRVVEPPPPEPEPEPEPAEESKDEDKKDEGEGDAKADGEADGAAASTDDKSADDDKK